MKAFCARFDVVTSVNTEVGKWDITANIIDNTGNFFAWDVNIEDIIYVDGAAFGMDIFKYKITNVDPSSMGTQLIASIEWAKEEETPMDPYAGLPGIIGRPTKLGLITLPSMTINMLDESFITSIKNYENKIIFDNLPTNDSPIFEGEPLVPTPNKDSNNEQIANTKWVTDKFETNYELYQCFEDIDAYKIVYINDSDKIGVANENDVNVSDRVLGISLKSKIAGEEVPVRIEGEITNENWNFEKTGVSVFVGNNGELETDMNKLTKFIQPIGTVSGYDSIIIDIEEAILL